MFSHFRHRSLATCSRLFVHGTRVNSGNYCHTNNSDAFRISQFTDKYLHNRQAKFTEQLKIVDPREFETFPIYRVSDSNGAFIKPSYDPQFSKEQALKMYDAMLTVEQMDIILFNSQRQGRISFYMTNTGEEASQVASAAALRDDDLVFAQYREAGVLVWRGFPLESFMHQCFGNAKDIGAGKQMPIHYGSADLNFVTISSPLATQIPQAVGAAYSFKQNENGRVVIVYFGEGAASEGDAHPALNFASTLKCPVIFFCRNNGYAISTPAAEQYGGDGIAGHGPGYGIPTIRVDGNDFFAVYNATIAARELASQNTPVLIEVMTYRVGHHSTSDDSLAYRDAEEINQWHNDESCIKRFNAYLISKGWMTSEEQESAVKQKRKEIMAAFSLADKTLKPDPKMMFTDVYKEMPRNLIEQRNEMLAHLKSYGDKYPLKNFESID